MPVDGGSDDDDRDQGAETKRRRVTEEDPSSPSATPTHVPRPPDLSTTPIDISNYTRGDWGISDGVSRIIDAIRSRPSKELSPGYDMIIGWTMRSRMPSAILALTPLTTPVRPLLWSCRLWLR
mmetsp:Transcript_11548/g.27256  ORF Transcript_11548/g.27256 Transcript_11548/m.27256 type:complete len:123 (+) Transcript_11548:53-421(+)